jgi:hypothetical protein
LLLLLAVVAAHTEQSGMGMAIRFLVHWLCVRSHSQLRAAAAIPPRPPPPGPGAVPSLVRPSRAPPPPPPLPPALARMYSEIAVLAVVTTRTAATVRASARRYIAASSC